MAADNWNQDIACSGNEHSLKVPASLAAMKDFSRTLLVAMGESRPTEQMLTILLGLKRTVVVNLDLQCSNGLLHGSNFGLYIL